MDGTHLIWPFVVLTLLQASVQAQDGESLLLSATFM